MDQFETSSFSLPPTFFFTLNWLDLIWKSLTPPKVNLLRNSEMDGNSFTWSRSFKLMPVVFWQSLSTFLRLFFLKMSMLPKQRVKEKVRMDSVKDAHIEIRQYHSDKSWLSLNCFLLQFHSFTSLCIFSSPLFSPSFPMTACLQTLCQISPTCFWILLYPCF